MWILKNYSQSVASPVVRDLTNVVDLSFPGPFVWPRDDVRRRWWPQVVHVGRWRRRADDDQFGGGCVSPSNTADRQWRHCWRIRVANRRSPLDHRRRRRRQRRSPSLTADRHWPSRGPVATARLPFLMTVGVWLQRWPAIINIFFFYHTRIMIIYTHTHTNTKYTYTLSHMHKLINTH